MIELLYIAVFSILVGSAYELIIKKRIRKRLLELTQAEIKPSSFLESETDEANKYKLIDWETTCDKPKCQACRMYHCVSGYCHNHCYKICKCGLGAKAQELIKKHGSLYEAEVALGTEQ